MSGTGSPPDDPRFVAGMKLLGGTGVAQVQIRYSDDEQPVIWFLVGEWRFDKNGALTRARRGRSVFATAAGMDPLDAMLHFLDRVIDGGRCTHCGRTTCVTADWERPTVLNDAFCWYVYDPELEVFRRSCEGDT